MGQAIDDVMRGLARGMALVGGLVLLAMVAMICASVLGNMVLRLGHSPALTGVAPWLAKLLVASGLGPIRAAYELTEIASAFVVFAFLPWVQLTAGHAVVDLFAVRFPVWANAVLEWLWAWLMAAALLVISTQLGAGMLAKMRNGETTFLLQLPLWWAYGASLLAASVAALVAVWAAARRLRGL
jgi:TRAP-type C4-dicarboxylate transport system permease small subunit